MKVVIYSRVSTDDKEQDPERQVMKCQQYSELHEHHVLEVLKDFCSGDSEPFERPECKKILDYDVEGIIIFSMDRLTRQHPIKVMSMLKNLKDRGIKVISITEPVFNMESEFSEVLLFFMTWWNNYFLTKLKRDIKSGMDRARANGKQIGRAKLQFNKFRAYQLLFNEKKENGKPYSQRDVSKELSVSLASINRFKREAEKKPDLYIIKDSV